MLKMLVAGVLVGHGLIHLMGVTAYMRFAELSELPYKTTLLEGRWDLGDGGMRVFGALWLPPAIGFVAAAIALLSGWSWWPPVLLAATVLSLALTVLDWQYAYMGVVVNVAILVVLWLYMSPWSGAA
jgi:hypothetical protein